MLHQARFLAVPLATLLASISAAAAGDLIASETEPPAHSKGGWIEDKGDGKKPRTPEQQAALDSVTRELKRLVDTHGPDSVVLQAKFLMKSVAAGATRPTEVRVAGPSTEAGPGHLEIDVETGLVFDPTTTAATRRETIWKDLALPVLDEMSSFKIEPSALELVFLFDVRHPQAADHLDADTHHESFRVRLPRELLDGMASDEVAADAVRDKAHLTEVVAVPDVSKGTAP